MDSFVILKYPKKFYNFVINLIYPRYCKSCSILLKQDNIFCNTCFLKIQPVAPIDLQLNKSKKTIVFAACNYKDPVKKLITEKLYAKNTLACKQLANIIYQNTIIKNLEIDYLIPVPLHWTRFAKRGYNQSYEIAKHLSVLLNVPVLDILKRNKKTAYQSSLKLEDRVLNVKDIFSIKNKNINLKNKNIYIVDDLFTTGATIKNCAKVLYQLKPESVNAIVACRVIQ
ncbi:MAG: ComF family protein [candidate division TM6 bacterium GW2011_GWF2_28_16]|nr:MAG: ComF family protein [candidate division TM6 bacterium GW2011_GWF2_28_16]